MPSSLLEFYRWRGPLDALTLDLLRWGNRVVDKVEWYLTYRARYYGVTDARI